eukprot:jgi/Mesvir1/7756/Mv11699-RA.1
MSSDDERYVPPIRKAESPTLCCLDSTKILHDAIFANPSKSKAKKDAAFHWNEVSKAMTGLSARDAKTKFGAPSIPLACDATQSALLFGVNCIIATTTANNGYVYDREKAKETIRLFHRMLKTNDCMLSDVTDETKKTIERNVRERALDLNERRKANPRHASFAPKPRKIRASGAALLPYAASLVGAARLWR